MLETQDQKPRWLSCLVPCYATKLSGGGVPGPLRCCGTAVARSDRTRGGIVALVIVTVPCLRDPVAARGDCALAGSLVEMLEL